MNTTPMTIFCAFLVAPVSGCLSADQTDTTARGVATYQDSSTDQQGRARPAAYPDASEMIVEIRVEGSGTLDGLEPECQLDGLAGSFRGLYVGEAELNGDGGYVAAMASGAADFSTPSGCEIPSVDISVVGDVYVRATLVVSVPRCRSYCAAKARSRGEAECGATPQAATCRADAEAQFAAECETQCTARGALLVAESKLTSAAVAALNARALTGAALGELEVNLTFDHIEDDAGASVPERE